MRGRRGQLWKTPEGQRNSVLIWVLIQVRYVEKSLFLNGLLQEPVLRPAPPTLPEAQGVLSPGGGSRRLSTKGRA